MHLGLQFLFTCDWSNTIILPMFYLDKIFVDLPLTCIKYCHNTSNLIVFPDQVPLITWHGENVPIWKNYVSIISAHKNRPLPKTIPGWRQPLHWAVHRIPEPFVHLVFVQDFATSGVQLPKGCSGWKTHLRQIAQAPRGFWATFGSPIWSTGSHGWGCTHIKSRVEVTPEVELFQYI